MNLRRAITRATRAALLQLPEDDVVDAFRRGLRELDNPRGPMTDAQARVQYRLTHWGIGGKGQRDRLRCADPKAGTYTKLGDLVELTYRTEKGGDGGVAEYTHEFSRPLPELLYSELLLIAGGGYSVGIRGIVK